VLVPRQPACRRRRSSGALRSRCARHRRRRLEDSSLVRRTPAALNEGSQAPSAVLDLPASGWRATSRTEPAGQTRNGEVKSGQAGPACAVLTGQDLACVGPDRGPAPLVPRQAVPTEPTCTRSRARQVLQARRSEESPDHCSARRSLLSWTTSGSRHRGRARCSSSSTSRSRCGLAIACGKRYFSPLRRGGGLVGRRKDLVARDESVVHLDHGSHVHRVEKLIRCDLAVAHQ
jgi:hypothetical protein